MNYFNSTPKLIGKAIFSSLLFLLFQFQLSGVTPDNNQLSLTCPPDIEVGPLFAECGIFVGFAALVWSSSEPVANSVFSVPSNHFFTYGTEVVTLTVTSTSGDVESCNFNVTVQPPPFTIECKPQVIVGFGGECTREITGEDILLGFRGCNDQYDIVILDQSGEDLGNTVDKEFVGPAWNFILIDLETENTCFGVIVVDGNTMEHDMTCPSDTTILCHELYDSVGVPSIDGCFLQEDYTHTFTDVRVNSYCDGDEIAFSVTRIWASTDPFGNSSNCNQTINANRVALDDIVFPLNRDGIQSPVLACTNEDDLPSDTDPSITGLPLVNGIDPSTVSCNITFVITDEITNVCGNHFEIERTWEALDYCLDESRFHVQTIILADTKAPDFSVPDTFYISTLATCGTLFLIPPIDLHDECSDFDLLIETPWQTHTTDSVISEIMKVPGIYNITFTATDDCDNSIIESSVLFVSEGVIATCPENKTISGDYYKDNLEEPLNNGDVLILNEFGLPLYYQNCVFVPTIDVQTDIDACYSGTIVRTHTVTVNGEDHICEQTITVEHETDIEVESPPEIDYYCDNNPINVDEPVVNNLTIEDLVISFSDEITTDTTGACLAMMRIWNIMNNCDPGFEVIVDQFIHVIDTISPVFTSGCTIPDICIIGNNCFTDLSIPIPQIDDCTNNTTLETSIFLSDTWLSDNSAFSSAIPGIYDIRYVATDLCNNQDTCFTTVKVVDCQAPTANCSGFEIVEILPPTLPMTVPELEVFADDFNDLSFDNCTGNLNFSFSPDVNDDSQIFDCVDLGVHPLTIFVTDENGNQDSCFSTLLIEDNMTVCVVEPFLSHVVATEQGEGIDDVEIINSLGLNLSTDSDGVYTFFPPPNTSFSITPFKNDDHDNGVTTFDIVVLTKHILGVIPLDSPYKIIAADANKSNSVTTFDAVEMRRLILGIYDEFPENTSWRFVPKDFVFADPNNPFSPAFPEVIDITTPAITELDFIGMKIGDLNGSASVNFNGEIQNRSYIESNSLLLPNLSAKKSDVVELPVIIESKSILGFQFALEFDVEKLELLEIKPGILNDNNFGKSNIHNGILRTTWNTNYAYLPEKNEPLFTLIFKSLGNGRISDLIKINRHEMPVEVYSEALAIHDLQLTFPDNIDNKTQTILFPSKPNPFHDFTTIGFQLPEGGPVSFTFYTPSGTILKKSVANYPAGYSEIRISASELNQSGIVLYRFESESGNGQGRMVVF